MSEMIQRVAKAWNEEAERWFCRSGDDGGAEICRHESRNVVSPVVMATVDHFGASVVLRTMRDNACGRAAIEVMREATALMFEAAMKHDDFALGAAPCNIHWQAMIDAAVKEPE